MLQLLEQQGTVAKIHVVSKVEGSVEKIWSIRVFNLLLTYLPAGEIWSSWRVQCTMGGRHAPKALPHIHQAPIAVWMHIPCSYSRDTASPCVLQNQDVQDRTGLGETVLIWAHHPQGECPRPVLRAIKAYSRPIVPQNFKVQRPVFTS